MKKFAKKSLSVSNTMLRKLGFQVSIKKLSDDIKLYHEEYCEDSITKRRFYNVSAGGHWNYCLIEHPYWTNLDLNGASNISEEKKHAINLTSYDMLQKQILPIESNSAEIILSQYSIEHVTNEAADFFFKESHRSLKENGVFRIVAPNTDLDVRAYNRNDRSYFWWEDYMSLNPESLGHNKPMNQASLEQIFITHFAANASTLHIVENPDKIEDNEFKSMLQSHKVEDVLDFCTSRCKLDIQKEFRTNHINWWNHNKVIHALKRAGFKDAYIVAPHQSTARVLRKATHFDKLWNNLALFVEAVK
jgi:predicted SAM-dependent methyltransferase